MRGGELYADAALRQQLAKINKISLITISCKYSVDADTASAHVLFQLMRPNAPKASLTDLYDDLSGDVDIQVDIRDLLAVDLNGALLNHTARF